jgi:hypothetical protein
VNEHTGAQLHVIRLVNATLGSRCIRWWLFGGWALDALLGEVTREHGDIEFWVERIDADAVLDALVAVGATPTETQPIEESREYTIGDVLFSSAYFDRRSDGTYGLEGRWTDWNFPVESFGEDIGRLSDMTVPVMSAAGMLAMKQQYPKLRNGKPLRKKDMRDIDLLAALTTRRSD